MKHYLTFRPDGTLNAIQSMPDYYSPANLLCMELPEDVAEPIYKDIESYIVEHPMDVANAHIRKRTGIEMETRVGEIYGRVRSGELHRVPNDLIDQYKHFFTLEELEEVELPEQKVKRLETRLKALETRLR